VPCAVCRCAACGSTWQPPPAPEGGPEPWPAGAWLRRYGAAWSRKYGALHYGQASDGKACGQLADLLAAMPTAARTRAEAMADGMIAEFLGRETPKVVQARHPFVFFVTEFGGLMVPQQPQQAPPNPRGVLHAWCSWHRRPGTAGKPSRYPEQTCPECRHMAAAGRTREGEPTPASPTYAPPPAWTEEQRREMERANEELRKHLEGG